MNTAHLHLLINHLPIIGSMIGCLVLAYAIWSKSFHTKIASYVILIISSVGAVITYLTGEEAEEVIEKVQGISKNLIDQHEDFSLVALIALIITGVFSLFGLFATIRKIHLSGTIANITLIISIISFGIIARAGYTGGQIRHSEINSSSRTNMQDNEKEDDN
jgi:hypothetical protein